MPHVLTALVNRLSIFLLLLFLTGTSTVIAAENRPKIGLVLGGGGAAGVAHVGVLKVLEEHNIPVDVIAGTSMGAIVGGLYASGISAAELEKMVQSLEWLSLFDDHQPREDQPFHQKQANSGFFGSFELGWQDRKLRLPSGLVSGQKLMFELRRLFMPVSHVQNFDQLPIPFRAVATDIETGEAVILKKGNLAQAVRASMAIPGMFSPVKMDNRLLVDGFVANNLPVNVARAMGADLLIVVNIPTFLSQQEELDSAVSVAMQAMRLMMLKSTRPQLETLQPQDILIEPGIRDIGNLDFDRVEETIPLGVQAALNQLPRLQLLSVSGKPQQPPGQARKQADNMDKKEIRIARIEWNNESGLSDALLQKYLGVKAGDRLDEKALQRGLETIHGLGEFDLVDHHLIRQTNGEYVLQVNALGHSAGHRRLRFGLSLGDDFEGDTRYQFGVRQITRGFNDRGSEWSNSLIIGDTLRLESGFYQPIPEHDMFVEPQIWHEQRDFYFYQDSSRLAEVRGREVGVQVDVGKEFGHWGEARAGLFYRYIKPDVTTGQIELPERVRTGGVKLRYQTDTMDDDLVPSQGRRFSTEYTHSTKALGSDRNVRRLEVSAAKAWSAHPHQLILQAEAGTTLTDDSLLVERLSLGGLGRMSGLGKNQLTGNHLLSSSLVYLRELSDFGGIAQFYVGGSLEAGNVWANHKDVAVDDLLLTGSVFVGADTPLGPALVGIAQTEGYEIRPFLYVGQGF